MHTYTQIIYQIVFGTKFRERTLVGANRQILYIYMAGIIKKRNCRLLCINAVEDHLHIVTHLHPSIALAKLVQELKIASNLFIREQQLFEHFIGWQVGYAAFTYTIKEKNRLINYVKNQVGHHKRQSYLDEFKEIQKEHGLEYDERFLL